MAKATEKVGESEMYRDGQLGKVRFESHSRPELAAKGGDQPSTASGAWSAAGRRLNELDAIKIAKEGGAEIDEEIAMLEAELAQKPLHKNWLGPETTVPNPAHYMRLLVGFASMGGLLLGIDQSLISGANLYMPASLHLRTSQVSLVASGVPLGAIGGALLLEPTNELVGRKWAIIISLLLYTAGAALEAGAISFGMMIAGRVLVGFGVGTEAGTVPVYLAESAKRKVRGNLVSLYQLNIAFGEVLGYVVAAIFVNVKSGSWRYILGSSLVFSTIMLIGMLFMPESPRFSMHKGRVLESFAVWKCLRGLELPEDREEFFIMKAAVLTESEEKRNMKRFVWLDFFTVPRARRSIVYSTIMIFLGQCTGINAIMYYMSILLHQVGFTPKNAVFMSLVGGGSLLIGTIPAIFYIERFGRRFWACVTLPGFFVGLLIISCSYLVPVQNFSAAAGVYITGLVIYESFFGSYACLTWVIPSEVFPTYLRSYGMESA
jgi:sugar porter (SP) family MFS transporter